MPKVEELKNIQDGEKKERTLQIGKAADLEAQKETLPAVEVKNHVTWINPNFPELPFDIQEGKPTKLSMFLMPSPADGEKIQHREVSRHHLRSGIVGRVVFRDKTGLLYRDVDAKGSGRLQWSESDINKLVVMPIEKRQSEPGEYGGLLEASAAKTDAEMAEYLSGIGVRTHRALAISALEELIDKDGKKISLDEARKEKIISEEFQPVIEARAFGTKARIGEIRTRDDASPRMRKRSGLLLEDAQVLVAQELGKSTEEFGREEYLEWIADTLGHNLALIHNDGWWCQYLGMGHNVTLDGRFTDFDSLEKVEDEDPGSREVLFGKDLVDLHLALDDFYFNSNMDFSFEKLGDRFIAAYQKTRKK
jgi:hypothetical protein